MKDFELIDRAAFKAKRKGRGVDIGLLIEFVGFCNYVLLLAATYPTQECRFWLRFYELMRSRSPEGDAA